MGKRTHSMLIHWATGRAGKDPIPWGLCVIWSFLLIRRVIKQKLRVLVKGNRIMHEYHDNVISSNLLSIHCGWSTLFGCCYHC